METRNILNSVGTIIGTLTLDSGLSEDVWTAALAPYTVSSPTTSLPPDISTTTLSSVSPVSTSSATPSTVGGMSCTPTAGKYLILYNGSISTNGASASGKFGVYVADVAIAETVRPVSCNLQLLGGLVTISLNAIGVGTYTGAEVTVDGTQTVDIKFYSTNGGTISFGERVMTLVKVS